MDNVWRKEKPREDGWYWYRTKCYGPSLGDVEDDRCYFLTPTALGSDYPRRYARWSKVSGLTGEWAGPVEWPVGEFGDAE